MLGSNQTKSTVLQGAAQRAMTTLCYARTNNAASELLQHRAVVAGFTVTGCKAAEGAAIRILGGAPQLRDLLFTGNVAAQVNYSSVQTRFASQRQPESAHL